MPDVEKKCISVEGGYPLDGELTVQGSKNAVLPILCAAILNENITVLENVPKISDVFYSIELLRSLGCLTYWDKDSLIIDGAKVVRTCLQKELVGRMRSSVLFIGALLGRMGEIQTCYPGGCSIGDRPIDLHVSAFRKMGARFLDTEEEGCIHCIADELTGCFIDLPYPSVGATENILLAAVRAKGTTEIVGAAVEPEIDALCRFLNGMGAKIAGIGTRHIVVEGVSRLHDTVYELEGDRIVTGTYMMAVASAGGSVLLRGISVKEQETQIRLAAAMGVEAEWEEKQLFIQRKKRLKGVGYIRTAPYPGFPTDLQAVFMAALATANGSTSIDETVFEKRFGHVSELNRMGADIRVNKVLAEINGVKRLHGMKVRALDLRGGAGLVVAALGAEGETEIAGVEYIARGYVDIAEDLRSLGARIRRV